MYASIVLRIHWAKASPSSIPRQRSFVITLVGVISGFANLHCNGLDELSIPDLQISHAPIPSTVAGQWRSKRGLCWLRLLRGRDGSLVSHG